VKSVLCKIILITDRVIGLHQSTTPVASKHVNAPGVTHEFLHVVILVNSRSAIQFFKGYLRAPHRLINFDSFYNFYGIKLQMSELERVFVPGWPLQPSPMFAGTARPTLSYYGE
jgi:hypothetical protein